MQNSELFRRGIVMPLTKGALDALLANDVDESIQVQWVEIRGDKVFCDIWSSNLFQQINDKTGSCIDDYEEEHLSPDKIQAVQSVIEEAISEHEAKPEFTSCLLEFKKIAELAHEKQMPLFFVL